MSETLKDKLKKLQNRAVRVVTETKYGSIEPDVLLKNLRWLNAQQLIDLDTASMVHETIDDVAPSYLSEMFHKTKAVHNHDTRVSTHGLFPKHSNLTFGQRSFASYDCKVWNTLDSEVQASEVIFSLLIKKSRQKSIEIEIAFSKFPWECQGSHSGSFLLSFTYPS